MPCELSLKSPPDADLRLLPALLPILNFPLFLLFPFFFLPAPVGLAKMGAVKTIKRKTRMPTPKSSGNSRLPNGGDQRQYSK